MQSVAVAVVATLIVAAFGALAGPTGCATGEYRCESNGLCTTDGRKCCEAGSREPISRPDAVRSLGEAFVGPNV